jgi:hypothetical protein
MSLQQIPPNHPLPEKSYPRSLFEYAWKETREHDKVELIASSIVVILAAFIGGFTWSGVAAGLVAAALTLAATLCIIFLIHLLRAPKVINKDLRDRLRAAQTNNRQTEIELRKTYKLAFEIDTTRSHVFVASYYDKQYSIMLRLYIRFENSDLEHTRRVKRVKVLLIKKNADETETEIPLTDSDLDDVVYTEDRPFGKDFDWNDRNLAVESGDWTPFHIIEGHISASGDPRKMLDKDCFLRVTMEAVSQPLDYLDFDVSWKINPQGWVYLTPRM